MIPSLLAAEVHAALEDFLRTGFTPSNPDLAHLIDDFLATPENLARGPYLSLQLPFQPAYGPEPFPQTPMGYVPYRHQRTAFERLRHTTGRSSVVATGTGSGKTECFLYPILDYCREQAGTPGIKAIIVYPMNALAIDQARRIAELVHTHDALRGKVTAGLFVGQAEANPHTGMGESHVISDRATMHEHPPDILLTNYKMLDYLLVRPRDRRLWRNNNAETLRYLVVDELHTFDGAQGTDLACLVRRLRARLGASREALICVGTSATIGATNGAGASASGQDLIDYVGKVFDQRFDGDSVVGETRQTIDEFLENVLVEHTARAHDDLAQIIDPTTYDDMDDYLRAQYELLFGSEPGTDFGTPEWRCGLGESLRRHLLFLNLLRALDGKPRSLHALTERLRPVLPVADDRQALGVLNSLCALIAFARRREGERERPFLHVGLQFWVRELRRMVASVAEPTDAPASETELTFAAANAPRKLRHSDDLPADRPVLHLPLVQCRECHATAWGTVKDAASSRVNAELAVFYNRFFTRDVDVLFLFPRDGSAPPPATRGTEHRLCGACGNLQTRREAQCTHCGSDRTVRVFNPEMVVARRTRDGRGFNQLSRNCPYCHAREAMIIIGARASSLLSVSLGQTYTSKFNDDHKVIAFSDNVQDAAHRAGFFAARTWPNGMRTAITQTIAAHDGITLDRLPEAVVKWWTDPTRNPGAFDTERFVAEFIAPDRIWLRDFEHLRDHGQLPPGSALPKMVSERLCWETLAEFGYRVNVGRTPERARIAAIGFDRGALDAACDGLLDKLRAHYGELRDLPRSGAMAILLGIIRRMKDRGAIHTPLVERVLSSGGEVWMLNRNPALQQFGPRSPHPVFPGERASKQCIERLAADSGTRSWYQGWCEKVLTGFHAMAAHNADDVLLEAMQALESAGLLGRHEAGPTTAWALAPERLYATTDVAVLSAADGGRELVVAASDAPLWDQIPCLDLGMQSHYVKRNDVTPTWFGKLYRQSRIKRVVAAEHTALLSRDERAELQTQFAADAPPPWVPNLLSATPTLEMGIDIGDLSTVVLCSVPPMQANYLQRIGRAGRRDGNAFSLTIAAGQPHDLYFYSEPLEMLAGAVSPPGVFLNASAVLARQLTAFCLDSWVASGVDESAVPPRIGAVLDNVQKAALDRFPYPFFDHVQVNAESLLESFLQAFERDLSDTSKRTLTDFMLGNREGAASFRYNLLNRLQEVIEERRSLRSQVDALKRRLDALTRGPEDEASKAQIDELTRERQGLRSLVARINSQETFNFLTDEGLLPNYAFPEAGVTLKSVIFRRLEGDDDEKRRYEHTVFEYMRPGSAAIGELAPENEFYAGGRRVEVDQIDLRVSPLEAWRLCPNCAYCERVDVRDDHVTCPRCGDPMWSDGGQRHSMLRLRQVQAFTADSRSRIADDRDDREPVFYTRDLVSDFAPEAVRFAYAISRPDMPFGFEYIERATFREMNFGRLAANGNPTRFAGVEMPRAGFTICRHCGKVQRSSDPRPEHSLSCIARDRDDAEDVVDCLYLYREFSSEAVRMLLPIADVLGSKTREHSFIAGLELGLRRHFGGRLDHLRAMTYTEPEAGTSQQRRYLMVYDTVPGGTGYLNELMSDSRSLLGVFQAAIDSLAGCECNQDPDKDGCYRCLLAYRRARDQATISRDMAVQIFTRIVDHADELKPVDGLAKVKVNVLLESELEARFAEALRRVPIDGEPTVVSKEIVNGKPGFMVRAGGRTWYMEPQVNLGLSDGVVVPSKPDFVLRPARQGEDSPPIAVFADGFEYHKHSTGDDSVKRMALKRAGFLVWSITWHDLEVAFGKPSDAVDPLHSLQPSATIARLQTTLDEQLHTRAVRNGLGLSSLELLLRYLARPGTTQWRDAVFVELLGCFDQQTMQADDFHTQFAEHAARTLPGHTVDDLDSVPSPAVVAARAPWAQANHAGAALIVKLPLAAIQQASSQSMVAAVHLDDDETNLEQADYRRYWNGALRAFNLLQFLSGGWWTSTRGVADQLYPEFDMPSGIPVAGSAHEDHWAEVVELADPLLAECIAALAAATAPVPEVGHELLDGAGAVVAEAELGWPAHRVAVVVADELGSFQEAGWHAFAIDQSELAAALLSVLLKEHT